LIEFKNNITNEPYLKIRSLYDEAIKKGEKNIQALLVASYSSKAFQFKEHPNISSLFFWQIINRQIRMKGSYII